MRPVTQLTQEQYKLIFTAVRRYQEWSGFDSKTYDECGEILDKLFDSVLLKKENKVLETMITTVEQDGDDLILPFPDEVLDKLGWVEGDTLEWIDNGDSTLTLKKV